jgi:AraC-like DNA-binding protein
MAVRVASSVSLTKCLPVLRAAERRGVPAAELTSGLGLDVHAPLRLARHVPCEAYFALWERAMAATRDPGFPMHVAQTPVEDYELVGYLMLTSATIGEAFARGARFQALWTAHGRWEAPVARGEHLELTWTSTTDARLGARVANECALASMLLGIRALARTDTPARFVSFTHSAPRDITAQRELFTLEPTFSATHNVLTIDRSTFELPIPSANVPLAAYLEEQCAALLSSPEPPTTGRLRRLLVESVPENIPTLEGAARRLAMSSRTLARRLEEEGTSFQGVLDDVRRELAAGHFAQGRLSVSEVAYLTGFRSVSAFHRAHRRWTGSAPGGKKPRAQSPR